MMREKKHHPPTSWGVRYSDGWRHPWDSEGFAWRHNQGNDGSGEGCLNGESSGNFKAQWWTTDCIYRLFWSKATTV